jgi:hypothetical protein
MSLFVCMHWCTDVVVVCVRMLLSYVSLYFVMVYNCRMIDSV